MRRIAAIDWMRGIVMVFMAVDHASIFLNPGRVADDSAATYVMGNSLPAVQFFTRWITHLCAPTFVFLAGVAIAVSTSRRLERGMTAWSIDRDLLIRGAFIALLDVVLMSQLAGHTILQVLYAIGVSMMLMVPLRRLGTATLLVIASAILIGGEAATMMLWDPAAGGDEALWVNLTLAPRFSGGMFIPYPALPWLAMMMLGWVFGDRCVARPREDGPSAERVLWIAGVASLVLFAVVRGLDGYGNMGLHRGDDSIVQWLHVSKYPPSIAFVTLELGLMALCLAALMRFEPKVEVNDRGPILVFGQTALFFYVLHFSLLAVAGQLVGVEGLGATYAVAGAVLVALYPVCLGFRALKRKHPRSLLRFV